MVNGIKHGGEIQKGKGCDRHFGHIEKNIVVNIKEGTFSRLVFSISRLEGRHKAGFIKVSLLLDCNYSFKYLPNKVKIRDRPIVFENFFV